MSERVKIGPGPLGAWRVGLRMLGRFTGLFAFLYALQLAVSAGAALVLSRLLGRLFAHRPLFDAAVGGDLSALLTAFHAHPWLEAALFWIGASAVSLYVVVSWFTTGGLIDVLLKRPVGRSEVAERFGRGGALAFFPYLRLFLWSLIPYMVCALALSLGLELATPDLWHVLTFWEVALPLAAGVLPGVLLFGVARVAVDYARIDLLRHPGTPAWRALLRAYRLLATRARPLLHALIYDLIFFAVSAAYLAITFGRSLEGLTGILSLLAIRQAVCLVRSGARFSLIAGQVELSHYLVLPPQRGSV